jgi:hypothetical protein
MTSSFGRLLAVAFLAHCLCVVGAAPASAEESLVSDGAAYLADETETDECPPCPNCCRDVCWGDSSASCWTATADALFLHRTRAASYGVLFDAASGNQVLSTSNLAFGTQAGPRIGLQRQLASGRILDIGYFGIEGWNSRADLGPGNYILTGDRSQSGPQAFSASFDYASSLHTVEINVRGRPGGWLQPLVGFRYVRLDETYQVTGLGNFGAAIPYSLTYHTVNDLFGGQIGGIARVWDRGGPLTVNLIGKSGLFLNDVQNHGNFTSSGVGLLFDGRGQENQAAFFSELGLMANLRLTDHWSVRGGYQMFWLNGVGLAPNEVLATDVRFQSGGVEAHNQVFFEGASVGLQANW